MAKLVKQERHHLEPYSLFDRIFDDWAQSFPARWPGLLSADATDSEPIRVEEFRDGDGVVIRAELPGIDPDKDVSLKLTNGTLEIAAERHETEHAAKEGFRYHEIRYGSFRRVLPLPSGAKESDIKATYVDGILEIRVPIPAAVHTTIPIAKGKG